MQSNIRTKFAGLIFFACLQAICARSQTNMLVNGSFEDINTCTEYGAECGVEGWFYLQDVKAQMLPIVDSSDAFGANSFGLYFQWKGRAEFSPLLGSYLPCTLEEGKNYSLTGVLSAQLNPRLNLKLGIATGEKFYVPGRAFSKGMNVDTIRNLTPLSRNGLFKFTYQFTATGKERYLTLGTLIAEDTVSGKRTLIGAQNVSVVLDNFLLQPVGENWIPCTDFSQKKAAIYAYNYRHKKMDYSLFAKGEVDIDFNSRYDVRDHITPAIKADTLVMGDVLFDLDRSKLKTAAAQVLKDFFSSAVNNNSIDSIYIEGHTDSLGSKDYNIQLSLDRCESVKSWIMENRLLAGNRVRVLPFGESRPIASNSTAAGRSMNRRVELLVFRRAGALAGEE